jgi:hypothetical protein
MDESTTSTRLKNEAKHWKDKYEEAKHMIKTSRRSEKAMPKLSEDVEKIWEQVDLVNKSIYKLFETFDNLAGKSNETSLNALLNFEPKIQFSNVNEEIEAFLAHEDDEVSVSKILVVLREIRAKVAKLITKSSELYMDQVASECTVQ